MRQILLAILMIILNTCISYAVGPGEGGGGVGVLCKTAAGESLTLLDLWEAQNVYSFGIPKSYGSIDKNLEAWGRDWASAQGLQYDPGLNDIKNQIVGIFQPVSSLPLSNDFSKWKALPINCQYIQIAKFIDPPPGTNIVDWFKKAKLEIVLSLYQILDEVNQSALLQHEYNYFAVRALSSEQHLKSGSDEARIWVAAEATGHSNLVAPQYPDKLICDFISSAPTNWFIHHFYAKADSVAGESGVRFMFQWINGYVLPLKATAFVKGLDAESLQNGDLTSPIDINVSYDLKIPGVNLSSFKIRLESSGDSLSPLKIVPMDSTSNIIANGACK